MGDNDVNHCLLAEVLTDSKAISHVFSLSLFSGSVFKALSCEPFFGNFDSGTFFNFFCTDLRPSCTKPIIEQTIFLLKNPNNFLCFQKFRTQFIKSSQLTYIKGTIIMRETILWIPFEIKNYFNYRNNAMITPHLEKGTISHHMFSELPEIVDDHFGDSVEHFALPIGIVGLQSGCFTRIGVNNQTLHFSQQGTNGSVLANQYLHVLRALILNVVEEILDLNRTFNIIRKIKHNTQFLREHLHSEQTKKQSQKNDLIS